MKYERQKRKLFFISRVLNKKKKAQEIMERNHHLATIIIIMNSDKSHEKMLKLLDKSRMRNGMII